MTALTELERLESFGAWRAGPDQRLRDVVVSFGDATIILTDPKSDIPLTHWSLPAVTRLNPGQMPAIYAPGEDDSDEQLEITEELMIEAIERVHRVIESRRAHPGRLRGGLTLLAALAMVLATIFWLPGALVRHAGSIAPPAQQAQIGQAVLTQIMQSTGAACSRNAGNGVLAHLAGKLLEPGAQIKVLPTPIDTARRLPGNLYIISDQVITGQQGPEAAARQLIAASLTQSAADALQQALDYAGPRAAAQLLTSGQLPDTALQGYGELLLSQPAAQPDDAQLSQALTERGFTDGAFLTEQQWGALQGICAG